MVKGKILVDVEFAIIREMEYIPNGFYFKLTFMSDKPPTYILPSIAEHVNPGDVWVGFIDGGWKIFSKEAFAKIYVPDKKE